MSSSLRTISIALAATGMLLAALLFVVGTAVVCLLAASDGTQEPPPASGPSAPGVTETVIVEHPDWPDEFEPAEPARADSLDEVTQASPPQE